MGHLTILAVYGATEGRDELNGEFYGTLQNILDKVKKRWHKVDRGQGQNWK